MGRGDMTSRRTVTSPATGAAAFGPPGAGIGPLLQAPLAGDTHAAARPHVEQAAPRPYRARLRPTGRPSPAASRRGTLRARLPLAAHSGERETGVGPAAAPDVCDASPRRDPVVPRGDGHTAGECVRRTTDGPYDAPATATAGSSGGRDDPTGDPGADVPVGRSVPGDRNDAPVEAVPVGRSGPTVSSPVGRGVPLGGATVAPAGVGR